MSGRPIDLDPADVAVDMLRAELPGFESKIVAARDAIGIRGALPIGAEVSRETVMYPVYSHVFVDVAARDALRFESDLDRLARHERQREALKRELAPIVERITTRIRELAIEATGLGPVITARVNEAREHGRRIGYEEGRAVATDKARREGYDAGVRSIVRILLQSDAAVGEAVDEIRASWEGEPDE